MDIHKVPCSKWPSELQALLKGDVLDAFLSISSAECINYDTMRNSLLVQAGISPSSKFQRLLQSAPKHGSTAAQYYGLTKDIITKLIKDLMWNQAMEKLSLEITY